MVANKTTVSKPEFAPLSVARMLWKHKLLIGILTILGCVIAIVIVLRLPAIYEADALVLVDSQKIPQQYVASTVNTNVQDRLATISQMILSETQLQKIIDNFGLYSKERKTMGPEEVIELMRKDITIKLERGWTGGQPGAFHVGYEGRSPDLVAQISNRLANLFIDENLRTRESQAEGTADFIDSQLADAKKTLDEEEAKLSQYKLRYNGELPEQENFLSQTLSRLQVQLAGSQDAINRAQQNKTMVQSALNIAETEEAALTHPAEASNHAAGEGDPAAVKAAAKKSEVLQQEYDALALRYKPNYPDMLVLKAAIERQRQIEASEGAKARDAANPKTIGSGAQAAKAAAPASPQLRQIHERIEASKAQLAVANQELVQRNSERSQILHQINIVQARIEQLPVREQEMAAVTRDYQISKDNYKSLLDKKLAAGMATDMELRQQAERFTLLDPARAPEKPIRPKRVAWSILGCLASLGLALGVAIGGELKKNAILGEWEIASTIPVLGRVPMIRPHSDSAASYGKPKLRFRIALLRFALVSSVVLALLAGGAAGAHFYLRWF